MRAPATRGLQSQSALASAQRIESCEQSPSSGRRTLHGACFWGLKNKHFWLRGLIKWYMHASGENHYPVYECWRSNLSDIKVLVLVLVFRFLNYVMGPRKWRVLYIFKFSHCCIFETCRTFAVMFCLFDLKYLKLQQKPLYAFHQEMLSSAWHLFGSQKTSHLFSSPGWAVLTLVPMEPKVKVPIRIQKKLHLHITATARCQEMMRDCVSNVFFQFLQSFCTWCTNLRTFDPWKKVTCRFSSYAIIEHLEQLISAMALTRLRDQKSIFYLANLTPFKVID